MKLILLSIDLVIIVYFTIKFGYIELVAPFTQKNKKYEITGGEFLRLLFAGLFVILSLNFMDMIN